MFLDLETSCDPMMEEIKAKLSNYKVRTMDSRFFAAVSSMLTYSGILRWPRLSSSRSFGLLILSEYGALSVCTLHVVEITPSCSKSSCKPGVPGTNLPKACRHQQKPTYCHVPHAIVRPTLGPGKDLPSWIKRRAGPTTSFAHHHVPS